MDKNELITKIEHAREVLRAQKEKYYSTHFYEFNKDVLGWPDIYEPLHKKVCDFVQDNVDKKKLLMLLPRGSFKSSIITVGYTLWRICKNPNERVLIANATYPMSVSFLKQIKDHLSKNETLKEIYGDLTKDAEGWRENMITLAGSMDGTGYRGKEPTVSAYGMESNLVGSHFTFGILDDMVNRDNINTREQLEKPINFFKDALDLIDPINGRKQLLVIGTTWHQSDLYSWIEDEESGVGQDFAVLKLPAYEGEWGKGKLLFPTRLGWEQLEELKRSQGSSHFCTPGESPVIMGDLSVKEIKDVRKGDVVCGWDDNTGNKAVLKMSKVSDTFKYEADVVEMKLNSGRIVRCTPEHKWFTGRGFSDKTHKRYKPARVGSRLMYIFNPKVPELTEEQKQLAHWLGGFFDADGSCGSGYNSIALHQSRFANPLTTRKLGEVFDKLHFKHNYWEKIYDKDNPRSRRGFKGMYWLNGGKQIKMDFLNLCKPFKRDRIIGTVYGKTDFIQSRDKVVSIKPLGKQDVYALETETGNYIVWGYGSSNSAQYLLNPVPREDALFKFDFKYFEETDLTGLDLNKFIAIDPALSDKKSADYSAMVCVGVDKNNTWYILDIWRDKVNPSRLIDQVFYWDEKWKPITIGMETVAFQKILQFSINDEMRKRNRFIPIKELTHHDKSKDERIRGLEPRYETGTVFHNKAVKETMDLEDELRRFPRGKNDDLIDALASILEISYPPRKRMERRTNRRTDYPA